MVKAYAILTRSLKKRIGSFDVRLQERRRIRDGIIVLRLCCKMNNCVSVRDEPINQLSIANIALNKGQTVFWNSSQIRLVACISELIKHAHMYVWLIIDHPVNEIRANKARTACYKDLTQNPLRLCSSHGWLIRSSFIRSLCYGTACSTETNEVLFDFF